MLKIIKVRDNIIILPGTKKIYKKLYKILNGEGTVAISITLENNNLFKNELYNKDIHILDGTYLFNFLCINVIEYILKANNSKFEELEITLLSNGLDDIIENNIVLLAKKCKLLNIVTNYPEKFEGISEKMQNYEGIIIRISRNKTKGLLKSGIVINYDFTEDMLKKCNFNNKAVLVNINEKIVNLPKSFKGINVNSYIINYQNNELSKFFSNEILYESCIYKTGNFSAIKEKILDDNIIINNLIGINGIINIKEFNQNVLTKMEY